MAVLWKKVVSSDLSCGVSLARSGVRSAAPSTVLSCRCLLLCFSGNADLPETHAIFLSGYLCNMGLLEERENVS